MRRLNFNHLMAILLGIAFVIVLFFNFADVNASYANCLNVEQLKKAQLVQAETSYTRFESTLRLLNIPNTPEVRRLRDQNIAFAREHFAPENCKKFYFPFIDAPINPVTPSPPPSELPPPGSTSDNLDKP